MGKADEVKNYQDKVEYLTDRIADLEKQVVTYEDSIIKLGEMLSDQKEKYAALLEKYIAMMEKAAKLDEQTVENTPDSKLEQIFLDFQSLIDKWFHNNGYDYQLDSGFKELRKKYLGW